MVLWNANGLSNHLLEIEAFLNINNIDILLVSETHFTKKTYMKIPNYKIYHTMHPDGTAHGGTAVIIKNCIKHFVMPEYRTEEIQATSIGVEDHYGELIISAIYSPPKHKIKKDSYIKFFKSLGDRFIAGGDYNAKHTVWGSRLITTKGRELLSSMSHLNLTCASTGTPTYWPKDPLKTPDLLDFCVVKGVSKASIQCSHSYELSSDHSPVFINIQKRLLKPINKCTLYNRQTNWANFEKCLSEELKNNWSLKTEEQIMEAIQHLTNSIQCSAWSSTPILNCNANTLSIEYSRDIKHLIQEKRKARKRWQESRYPPDKSHLNKLSKKLDAFLQKEKSKNMSAFISDLDSTAAKGYSLWKITKKIGKSVNHQAPLKRPNGTWTRNDAEKSIEFGTHLKSVFTPNLADPLYDNTLQTDVFLKECHQMDLPLKRTSITEITTVIKSLKRNKTPSYDLISTNILLQLPQRAIEFLMHIYNACLTRCFFPDQWKVAEVIMIPKPGKDEKFVDSYRPISLLSTLSKILEIIFIRRLLPVVEERNLIPSHQFGFRKRHGTVEQIHRLVEEIHSAFDKKKYCTGVFLDIAQAFDKVWHKGLLFKLKKQLPTNCYLFLQSYLNNRMFRVRQGQAVTTLNPITAGVPQGSVLGPILYLLFTSDLPVTHGVLIGTFADDTALMSTAYHPKIAASKLQRSLNNVSQWLKTWRIKANEAKSKHVTFTLRKQKCPNVNLNDIQIPQSDSARYLGIHLDNKLTWKHHILTKRKALGLQLNKFLWLINQNSPLSLENKLIIYKSILKPIWSYGVELWGTAAKSHLDIIQRFQSKTLRIISNAPYYVTNVQLHRDLNVPLVEDEIKHAATRYYSRILQHPNGLANNLMKSSSRFRRLQRKTPIDLQNNM